jgi:hypothetical protein
MTVEIKNVGVGGSEATRISQRFFHGLLGRGDKGLRGFWLQGKVEFGRCGKLDRIGRIVIVDS